jgi:hypothetical protein
VIEKQGTSNALGGDDEQEEGTREAIYFEPSFKQVLATVLRPFDWLVDSVHSLFRLEKDLVPLIDIERKVAFKVDEKQSPAEFLQMVHAR